MKAPLSAAEARAYTALGRAFAKKRTPQTTPAEKPWIITKKRPGQNPGEIFFLTTTVGGIFVTGATDAVTRLTGLEGWHWLWMAPAALALAFVSLHILGFAALGAGIVSEKLGLFKKSSSIQRTHIFFVLGLTVYAAGIASSGRWLAPVGWFWLVLVALNTAALVWIAMKSAEE